MTTFAVYETATGALVSVGTVVADPLPVGLVATQVSQQDFDAMQEGSKQWDPSTLAFVATPGWVDPAVSEANRSTIEDAITAALTELQNLIDAPALPTVPSGTMTTAQLSSALRTLRDECQATRAGAQKVAHTLKQTIRLVRGDFDGID